MTDVLIYGGGMLGQQVAHLLGEHFARDYRILGYVDDVRPQGSDVYQGLKVVGSFRQVADRADLAPQKVRMVFAIGYTQMRARGEAFRSAKAAGYSFVPLVHPHAHVETSATIGEGTTVLAGSVVDQFVSLGEACYVHIGCIMGEGSKFGPNNYFSAAAAFGGSITIGSDNFFGLNCTIVNGLTIGNGNFINAGSLVYKNLGDNMRVAEYREQRLVAMC